MIAEITNLSFAVDGDVFTVSGTLQLIDESTDAVLYTKPVSAKGNFRSDTFYDDVKADLTTICQATIDAYEERIATLSAALGVSTPQEGLDKLAQDVQDALKV